MSVRMQNLVETARANPAQSGVGFLIGAILLKSALIVKIVTYALLTLGFIFIWEALKQHNADQASLPEEG